RAERRSKKTGSGVEFADYREYSVGDDYRHVDWNAYGRLGRLLLRLYETEEDLCVDLLIDCSRSMAFGAPTKLDYAKKLSAALAYVNLSHLDRVAINAFRDGVYENLPATRGRHRIFGVFEFLRALTPEGGTDLAASAGALAARLKRRGVVILLSDLYDASGFERGVNRLRYAKQEVYVIQLTSSEDARPALRGDVDLVDSETGEMRSATITPELLDRYAQARSAHQERIARFCAEKHVPLFVLDTSVSPEDAMLRILRRGGMLR
ncbi:MAG TPA: DUF58 domain-containing protein, partial [Polyangiales bacterium]|nr:DUF58 domain-containing protein [Polyangiales bacterium]